MSGTSSPAPRPRVKCEGVTFEASRPAVLPLVHSVSTHHWGWALEFRGAQEELVAAGVADRDMFEDLGKSGQRKRTDIFGDEYTVRRMARGRWHLERRFQGEERNASIPSDEFPDRDAWWIKYGGIEAEAAMAEILKRFARPAKGRRT